MSMTVALIYRFHHSIHKDPMQRKKYWKVTFLTSLLDLNVCGIKESLSIASISLTRFTCSTRLAWSMEKGTMSILFTNPLNIV